MLNAVTSWFEYPIEVLWTILFVLMLVILKQIKRAVGKVFSTLRSRTVTFIQIVGVHSVAGFIGNIIP